MDATNIERFRCDDVVFNYKCKFCSFTTDFWITLGDHIWNHEPFQNYLKMDTKIKSYTCKICNFASYSLLVWFAHGKLCRNSMKNPCQSIESDHGTSYKTHVRLRRTSSEKIISFSANIETIFYCKLCEYKTKYSHNLQAHVLRRHTDPENRIRHKCNQCSFEAFERGTLRQHVIRSHTNIEVLKLLKCDHCGYRTNKKHNLRRHILRHQVLYNCKTIKKAHVHVDTSTRPYDTKSEENKQFACDQCNYKAKLKRDLEKHITRKHPSLDQVYFECSQCSYKTVCKRYLKAHMTGQHTDLHEIKWFKCDQCEYKAKKKHSLTRHIKTKHSFGNEVHFECSQCTYKTLYKRNLRKHMIYYHLDPDEGFKWLKCDVCEYKARDKSSLKLHYNLIHARENLVYHECSQCSYKAGCKGNLRSHIIARHTDPKEIKWFKCDKCDYKAKLKRYLRGHIRLRHNRSELQ